MGQWDSVVVVDENGNDLFNHDGRLSTVRKIEAHRLGLLHRAVSVFVFNDRNELLLQQRNPNKYHSPKKWTNTCCTHPAPGESTLGTAQRRLIEEMGLKLKLTEAFTFIYKTDVGNGLIENEFDHVFFGISNQNPNPDPAEVSNWNWVNIDIVGQELIRNPEAYSPWFKLCFGTVVKHKLRD